MIKIGMLLPYEDMMLIAKRVIEETGIQVDYIKVVNTVDAVNEARNALEAGAHILIARGYKRNRQKFTFYCFKSISS